MKINFSQLQQKAVWLNWSPADFWMDNRWHKYTAFEFLGEALYFNTKDMELAQLAPRIYWGDEVEMKLELFDSLKKWIDQPQQLNAISNFLQRITLEFLSDEYNKLTAAAKGKADTKTK